MKNAELLTNQELLTITELGKALTSILDIDRLFEILLKKLSDLIPAQNWSLLLLDHDTDELFFQVCVGISSDTVKNIRLKLGEGIAGQVALEKKAMIIKDVSKSSYFADKIDKLSGFNTKSIICVPLIFGKQTVGVLEAINPDQLDDKAVALLRLIADYAAIAVENTRHYHQIQKLVNEDNLTGLYNTRYLYNQLEDLIDICKKDGCVFSLIFLDIDNFKHVVDTHGHLNGSKAIQELSDTIKESLVSPAYAVSYAGDEFVIVLPDSDKEKALDKAEEIRLKMKKTLYLKDETKGINLFASFGVASFPEDGENIIDLLGYADKAMFKIKREGKNAVSGDI